MASSSFNEDGENAWVTDPKIRGPVRRMVAFIETILMYWSPLSDGDGRSAVLLFIQMKIYAKSNSPPQKSPNTVIVMA